MPTASETPRTDRANRIGRRARLRTIMRAAGDETWRAAEALQEAGSKPRRSLGAHRLGRRQRDGAPHRAERSQHPGAEASEDRDRQMSRRPTSYRSTGKSEVIGVEARQAAPEPEPDGRSKRHADEDHGEHELKEVQTDGGVPRSRAP